MTATNFNAWEVSLFSRALRAQDRNVSLNFFELTFFALT